MRKYEIHYEVDGVKHWAILKGYNKQHAIRKLYLQHDDRFVHILDVFPPGQGTAGV